VNLPRLAAVAAAITVVLSGCLDFEPVTEPRQPAAEPAAIFADFSILERAGAAEARVEVTVLPGRDAQGPRTVRDSVLWLNGLPLRPYVGAWPDAPAMLRYSWASAEIPETIEARPPTIDGLSGSATPIRWRIARADADTIRLVRGADLVLRLATAAPDSAASFENWSVSVQGSGGTGFSLSRAGSAPDTLRIPAAWISADDSLAFAHFGWSRHTEVLAPGGDLFVRSSGWHHVQWVIRLLDP